MCPKPIPTTGKPKSIYCHEIDDTFHDNTNYRLNVHIKSISIVTPKSPPPQHQCELIVMTSESAITSSHKTISQE